MRGPPRPASPGAGRGRPRQLGQSGLEGRDPLAQHVAMDRPAGRLELGGGFGQCQPKALGLAGAVRARRRSNAGPTGTARRASACWSSTALLSQPACHAVSIAAASRRLAARSCPWLHCRRSSRAPPACTSIRGPTRAGCSPRSGWRWREHTRGVCAARLPSLADRPCRGATDDDAVRGLQGRHPESHRP